MRLKLILIAIVLCLIVVPLLKSQSPAVPEPEIKVAAQPYVPQESNAIRVKATMVDVNVVIRDERGQPVGGLTRDDFAIYDQGRRQKITSFTAEVAHPPTVQLPKTTAEAPPAPPTPPPPRYLGLYFDDQTTTASELVYARKAAEKFIRDNMEETDRAAIFTSSETVTQQFTSNKRQLLDTLAKLLSHKKYAVFHDCLNITPYEAFQITQFWNTHSEEKDDAMARAGVCGECDPVRDPAGCSRIVDAQAATVLTLSEGFAQDSLGVLSDVVRYMGKMPGRRTLIMASSGFFSESTKIQQNVDKMIAAAIHNGIIVNTLDTKGLYAYGDVSEPPSVLNNGYEDAKPLEEQHVLGDTMSALAYGTGGKFFHNSNDIDGGLRELASRPEVSYILGFSPDEVRDNGVYHNLKIKLPNHQYTNISARPGYFELTKQEALPAARFQKLNKEVMSSDTLTEIQAEVTTQSGALATGEPALKVVVHVPGRSLYFKKINKLHNERVIFITAIFDMQNHYLAGTEAVMDMNLKDATFAQLSHDGVDAKSTLQAPPGSYRLRQVVQEVVGGRIATTTREVQIR